MFNSVSHVLVHSKCLKKKRVRQAEDGPGGPRTYYISEEGKLLAQLVPFFSLGANTFTILAGS